MSCNTAPITRASMARSSVLNRSHSLHSPPPPDRDGNRNATQHKYVALDTTKQQFAHMVITVKKEHTKKNQARLNKFAEKILQIHDSKINQEKTEE
jgi:hypothetical protein